jgi:gamma-glutamylcyclotransferase (GGCT)/AIG2-like uncharacterized protein YtfP
MHRVFVCGSLRRGQPNHHLLGGSAWIADTRTADRCFAMLDLGGEAGVVAVDDGPGGSIAGEVYEVDDATLARIGRHEAHPIANERSLVTLLPGRGEYFAAPQAWMYLWQFSREVEGCPRVPRGDWVAYRDAMADDPEPLCNEG